MEMSNMLRPGSEFRGNLAVAVLKIGGGAYVVALLGTIVYGVCSLFF